MSVVAALLLQHRAEIASTRPLLDGSGETSPRSKSPKRPSASTRPLLDGSGEAAVWPAHATDADGASTRPLLDGSGEEDLPVLDAWPVVDTLQRGRCSTAAVRSLVLDTNIPKPVSLQRGRCSTAAVRKMRAVMPEPSPVLQRGRCSTAAVRTSWARSSRASTPASTRPLLDGSGENVNGDQLRIAMIELQRGRCSTAAVRPHGTAPPLDCEPSFNEAAARRQR